MLSYPFLICLYLTPCVSSRLYAHWDFVCGLCAPATNSACEYVCNCYPKLYPPRICLITFISCLSLPSLLLLPPLLVLRRSLHQSRPTRCNGRWTLQYRSLHVKCNWMTRLNSDGLRDCLGDTRYSDLGSTSSTFQGVFSKHAATVSDHYNACRLLHVMFCQCNN